MEVVSTFTGAFQVNGNGAWGTIGTPAPLVIPQNGYLAVFESTQTAIYCDGCQASASDVYFDQLMIRFTRGQLKEESHYYPFGLPMGDMGSAAAGFTPNRQKYQSNEYVKDADLNWMDFHARQYDPQIGKFLSVDPLAAAGGQERLSPNAAMGNNPAGNVDPMGTAYIENKNQTPVGLSRSTIIWMQIPVSSNWDYGAFFDAFADRFSAQCFAEAMAAMRKQAEESAMGEDKGSSGECAGNYDSKGNEGGGIDISLSNMAWYDGDKDGKPGLSKDKKSEGNFFMEQLGNFGLALSATGQAIEGHPTSILWKAALGKGLDYGGEAFGFLGIGYDMYQYSNNNMSTSRFAYHGIGFLGAEVTTHAIGGTAGLGVGGGFLYLELTYDLGNMMWNSFTTSYNNWYNSYMHQISGR